MVKKAVLISIHSRKGGVGKTSIAMSAAIQLAALGKKVAVLDLDTHGAHLSQSLPLKNDLTRENGTFVFNPGDEDSGGYSDKAYLAWRFTKHLKSVMLKNPQPLHSRGIVQQLAIEQSVMDSAAQQGVGPQMELLNDRLYLFPMSPFIRDIDRLNSLALREDGQKRYREVLTKLLAEMDEEGYEYIVIDNSPGLSLNPGLTLQVALAESIKNKREVHGWFVGNSPWWEQGLILYEMNVYRQYLMSLNTTLIVNRVGEKWLDDSKFYVGEHWVIQRETGAEQFRKLVERLFCIPMWVATDPDSDRLANKFLLPERFSVSILGDDDTVRKAQMTDADWRPAGDSTNGKMAEPTGVRLRDFVILATRYLYFFALPAVKATQTAQGNTEDAFAARSILFHRNVYTALVEPLINRENKVAP